MEQWEAERERRSSIFTSHLLRDDAPDAPDIKGFTELEEIGRGGMGVVFKANQNRFRRTVAIKVMTGSAAARFSLEMVTQALLDDHPNIVPVLHADECIYDGRKDVPFFAMRFVDGRNLGEVLRERALPHQAVIRIMSDVCSALSHAHDQGIIHRDVKPGNILIERNEHVYLTDFGIAFQAQDDRLTTNVSPATLRYAAPEVLQGDVPTVASDIYSCGIVLYEMMTGRQAVGLLQGLKEVPDDFGEWKQVIKKATAYDPEHRYESIRQFGEAILCCPDVDGIRETFLAAEAARNEPTVRAQSTDTVDPGLDVSGSETDELNNSDTDAVRSDNVASSRTGPHDAGQHAPDDPSLAPRREAAEAEVVDAEIVQPPTVQIDMSRSRSEVIVDEGVGTLPAGSTRERFTRLNLAIAAPWSGAAFASAISDPFSLLLVSPVFLSLYATLFNSIGFLLRRSSDRRWNHLGATAALLAAPVCLVICLAACRTSLFALLALPLASGFAVDCDHEVSQYCSQLPRGNWRSETWS